MNATSDAPLSGGHTASSIDPRERRRQVIYLAWSLGLILLINALYLSSAFLGSSGDRRETPEHLTEPSPGVLAP